MEFVRGGYVGGVIRKPPTHGGGGLRSKTERAALERGQNFVESWSKIPLSPPHGGALPQGEPFGTPRRRPLRWGLVFVRGRNLPRQAPSVPIRRAGRRARDEIRVMLYALGGEKSPIGGICNSSGAAHLNRRFLREVRSEFFWTVACAGGRSRGTLANFFL